VRKYKVIAAILMAVNLAAWTAHASIASARESKTVDENCVLSPCACGGTPSGEVFCTSWIFAQCWAWEQCT
jgi:hypothetical protein